MPQPQQFAGGVSGYSSAPLFSETMAALEANNPGQFAAIQNMFINPQTGVGGYQAQVAAQQAAQAAQAQQRDFGGGGAADQGFGGRGAGGFQGPNPNGDVGYGAGGYTSFGDMSDRGGAGVSGGQYSGGGFASDVGNFFGGAK
jgi:hypothetical protein